MTSKSDKANDKREIVSQKRLAYLMSLSQRQVYRLQADGIIHRDSEENGYDLRECSKNYLDYKLDSESGRRAAISKEQVQAEHEKVKMDISKLKLRRLRRESIDIRAMEICWSNFLTYFISKLDTLGSKIIMAAAGAEVNEQIKIADGIVAEMKKELCDFDPKNIDDDSYNDELYDDEDEDDEDDDE